MFCLLWFFSPQNKSINDFFSSAPQERAEPDESNALDLSAFLDGDDEDFASIPCWDLVYFINKMEYMYS